MAIHYVTSGASGSGDGSSVASAWTFAQMLAATPAAGDEIRICADATYSRSATGTIAYANGSGSANIVITGANASGTVDGTRPTIQASAGSITLLNITGSGIRVDYLILDGNNQTSVTGLTINNHYTRARFCKAINCTTIGLNLGDSLNTAFLFHCEATGCSGTCAFYVGGQTIGALYCEAYANKCHGFQVAHTTTCVGCTALYNTTTGAAGGGGSFDGFTVSSVGASFVNCASYGNGRAGFGLYSNAALGSPLTNCIAYGNGGEGFGTDGVKSAAFLLNCAGGSNTSGNYNAANLPNVTGFVALSGDPFNGAATGDFSLNNTAGAGAACRAAGYPGLLPRGVATGYADIGAVQHQDSGGGGTGAFPVVGCTFIHAARRAS